MNELTERMHELIGKAIDGNLTGEEATDFEALLSNNPALRKEFESQQSLREMTMEMKLRKAPEETWDRYWAGVYSRLERGLAWLLISLGAAALAGAAAYSWIVEFFVDTESPLYLKLAIASLAVGAAILFVSVIREKLFTRKADKYREVIR